MENGFGVQSVTSMWRIEMIETSPFASGGGTRWMEGTRNRLQTRSTLLSWRRGKRQVRYWTKRRRNSSILEIIATPCRWRIYFWRKGIIVVVVPRHPLWLDSPMVWTWKQLLWLIHRPSETCRRAREYLLNTWIFLFKQILVPTSNTYSLSTVLFIRLDVFENLWHYLQNHTFVMVHSVGLDLALFIRVTTASI